MSNLHLPTETLDHVVDLLHDTKYALRNCCLVSKSWIPRTRKHLFANVSFSTEKELESWKVAFPDPSTSPTHYTKTLFIDCVRVRVAVADAEAGGWIRGFSRVVHLKAVAISMKCTSTGWQTLSSHSMDSRDLTHHRIPPHESSHLSVFADFRPRSFVTTSREPDCGHRQSAYLQ